MNKLTSLLLLLFLINTSIAQQKVNLKFNFYFSNSNEGYIKKSKLVVKSDGVKIGESSVKDQDKYNSVEVSIPKGYHKITAVAYAQNDGTWEERTLANNYSLDCIYEKSQNWNTSYIIDLRFDLKDMDVKVDEEILFSEDMLDNLTNNNSASSSNSNSTTNYQSALKKLNDYLKTFDNGYYGYWEVKDGYIYDRFKAGKYNKFKMEDMEGAVIQSEYSRVIFKCKGDNKCIETDWTLNGREDYTQFTTSGSYNYKELADLLNNFRDAYLGKNSTNSTSNSAQKYTESAEFLDGLKSNNDNTNSGSNKPANGRERVKSSTVNNNSSSKMSYTNALLELNKFLKDYDKELNKSIEVSNGYIIEHFRGTYTSKAKISDIEGIEKDAKYNVVQLYCKNKSKCVYSDYMKSDYDYFNYNCSSASQMITLYDLMTEFWYQLTGKKTPVNNSDNKNLYTDYYLDNYKSNSNTTTSGGYQMSLNKLNDFLKTFAKGFYIKLEVIDGYIFTRFENGYFNQFKMQDMQDAVIDEANHKVLFKCKGDIYCQTTTWKKNSNYYSHFIDDNATYEQLVKLRDLLNTFKKDYLADKNNTTTTTNNDNIDLDKYKSNINISDNPSTATSNTRPTPKINYEIVAKQPSVFKKGDKVVIEIGSFDDHFQLSKKSEYDGETGTVINLEYDDLNYSYYGKIKMDSDNKIVEFTDITPQLIKIK